MKKFSLLTIYSLLISALTMTFMRNGDADTGYMDSSAVENFESLDLGTFSMSLAVKDIGASLAFYEKLGFQPIENAGSVEQKWLLLSNGITKIGLFQGMFPTNTLTFNPADARAILAALQEKGIETTFSMGMENTEGPCSFAIADPDGNPILIDQH